MKLDDDNSLVSRLWQKTIDESSAGINTDAVTAVPSIPWVEMMTPGVPVGIPGEWALLGRKHPTDLILMSRSKE